MISPVKRSHFPIFVNQNDGRMKKRVVVGLSGGVDSSVAAFLLKEQGYDVIGLFMKNWHDESVTIQGDCPWLEDSNDALIVAEKLGIPFQTIDFSEEYKERIVNYMFREYENGRTPNPDILCNREIKFDLFLKAAERLNADFVATGHYCRKEVTDLDGKPLYHLLAGNDNNKDQSYFLCQLTQAQLSKALFPIGELTKPQVRTIARKEELITAEKRDSQGLCFIGKVRLPDFLQQQLKPKEGHIIEIDAQFEQYGPEESEASADIEVKSDLKAQVKPYIYTLKDGKVVGNHNGAHFFTIGQRKGMAVGGTPKPLFVIATDTKNNLVYAGQGEDHPGLYRQGLFVPNAETHWLREDLTLLPGQNMPVQARIRYRQPLEAATLFQESDGLYVIFENPQRSIAKGQFVAWYLEDELLGSGVID